MKLCLGTLEDTVVRKSFFFSIHKEYKPGAGLSLTVAQIIQTQR